MDNKIRGIGEIIWQLRIENGLTIEQLSNGICTISELSKIEQNVIFADCFLIDRLFARMGKSVERLEYVLTVESYELYELRQLIQEYICFGSYKEAEKLLWQYEKKKCADRPLHKQYIQQEYAQIEWMCGKNESALEHINIAIEQTMPHISKIENGMVLSAMELKLLLFRLEISEEYINCEKLNNILEYIERKKMSPLEKVKVYPYAILLYGKAIMEDNYDDKLCWRTKEALDLLRDTGKVLYLPEILEQYAIILNSYDVNNKLINILRSEKNSLLRIEEQYNISFQKYRLYDHVMRRFEIDSELIRKNRMTLRMTQEKLSENICTQATLARIEKGKRSPHTRNFKKLMNRMGKNGERISAVITTDRYEILELKREFAKYAHRNEYDQALSVLNQIEAKLDCSLPQNYKYVRAERIMISYHNNTEDWQCCLNRLWELLDIRFDWASECICEQKLSTEEMHIISSIALIYVEHQEEEKALKIYQLQIKQYNESRVKSIFHMLEWELAMGNLATSLEEKKMPEKAIEISQNKIKMSLMSGKGNSLGRSLITIACSLEQMNEEKCIDYFNDGLRILKLFNMDSQYQSVINYLRGKHIVVDI